MSQDYSYLLRRQSDPERLKRKAYEEFASARNSGRLIAFVGSYASAHLGYPNWNEMVQEFLARNGKDAAALSYAKPVFDQLSAYSKSRTFSDVDLMDLAELMAGIDKHADAPAYAAARKPFEESFQLRQNAKFKEFPNAAAALLKDLGITRFMTLNYDLEIEWQVFLTDYERDPIEKAGRPSIKVPTRKTFFFERVERKAGSPGRLERAIPGRGRVTSDIVSRENSAQLIEFALSSPMLHSRILHLHGRADDVTNLLVTRRDYRDRYWRGGFSKLPFEYGMRLIFAGNPILLVGLGAKEDDVMRVLEQFLSDNPNRRAVPMFMVWNSTGDKEDQARRLLFNRKFGIHLLFDREVAELVGQADDFERRRERYAGSDKTLDNAFRLIEPLKLLAPIAERVRSGSFWKLDDFRTPQGKFDPNCSSTTRWRAGDCRSSYRVDVWRHIRDGHSACGPLMVRRTANSGGLTSETRDDGAPFHSSLVVDALGTGHPIKAIIGESAYGRGAIADAIACGYEEHFADKPAGRVVVVNGAFATDTDSIFAILSGASDQFTAQAQKISRTAATRQLFEPPKPRDNPAQADAAPLASAESAGDVVAEVLSANPPGINLRPGPLTIIINGMERFIAHDGSALSNEVDMLIRLVIEAYRKFGIERSINGDVDHTPFPLTLLLLGTQRLLRYMDVVARDTYDKLPLVRRNGHTVLPVGDYEYYRECSPYFEVVAKAVNATKDKSEIVKVPPSYREKSSARRTFFERIFDGAFPACRGVSNPVLAFELLRTLAYIGQPVEKHVLYHVPSLLDPNVTVEENRQLIDACVQQLKDLVLVLQIDKFPDGTCERLGLHKTVVAEVRERYGVPMSDSRLANGFNLSLFAAQPVDTYTPDQRWHDEIGKLLDFLIGPYRDEFDPPHEIVEAAATLDRDALLTDPLLAGLLDREHPDVTVARLAAPETADCLRAALSLLRSYYSVPALLMHSNRDLDPWMRDGPLSEHADRLTRLLRVAKQTAQARRLVTPALATPRLLGPFSFYPDDLVWLNNELAVVRLTQGNLYEARRKLQEASRLNREYVEREERQQNWRRIELNRLQADIDRGMIERAEDRIRDIELMVEEQARMFRPEPLDYFSSARDYIVKTYAPHEDSDPDGRPSRLDYYYPTDLVLTTALAQGYRGLCQHLRGALEASRQSFATALKILLHLNEQRAYAFFMRHAASVEASLGQMAEAEKSLRLCVAAAGHGRQTDVDHSGRISMVQYGLSEATPDGQRAPPQPIPQLTETLRYATASDMYRLQIEAMQTLASVHLRNGDADSALRFATDALAIATRCGFGLRKVSLRILLGRVMAFRNELKAARELLESASLIGTKLHYEQAVEAAEDERVRIGD